MDDKNGQDRQDIFKEFFFGQEFAILIGQLGLSREMVP